MKRKVVKHGVNTLTVSLPSKWIKKNNIKKGDEVNILDEGDCLKIQSIDAKPELITRRVVFDVTDLGSVHIRTLMGTAVKAGFNEIKLIYKNKFVEYTGSDKDLIGTKKYLANKMIVDYCNNDLLGFEIIDQGKDYTLIKQILDVRNKELSNIVRRIFLHMKTIVQESVIAIKNQDFDRISNLRMIEPNTNKMQNYCKMIMLSDKKNIEKNLLLNEMIAMVEIFGDYWAFMLRVFQKRKKPISKEMLGILEKLQSLFNLTYDHFYKQNNKEKRWSDLKTELKEDILAFLNKRSCDTVYVNLLILQDLIAHIKNSGAEYNLINGYFKKNKK